MWLTMNPSSKLRISMLFMMLAMAMVFGIVDAGGNSRSDPKIKASKKRGPKSNSRSSPGILDFQTKMVLVSFSIFMLIFVVVLLAIGHFTWFADIRNKLEQEWEEELKREEENQIASSILNEMTNPFAIDIENNNNNNNNNNIDRSSTVRRKSSVDSNGCARGQCVPPHHSILCPNNPNVPSLSDPLPFGIREELGGVDFADPVDYRSVRSRDWMNLDSSVKVISEPVPVREQRFMSTGANFSTGSLVPKPPVTPSTPGPFEESDEEEEQIVEVESGHFANRSTRKPSVPQFDISKLDLF